MLLLLIKEVIGLFFKVEWIRGQWRYSLTTEDLKAEIQVEYTGGFDPEVMPYPQDYIPSTILVRSALSGIE